MVENENEFGLLNEFNLYMIGRIANELVRYSEVIHPSNTDRKRVINEVATLIWMNNEAPIVQNQYWFTLSVAENYLHILPYPPGHPQYEDHMNGTA